MDHRLKTVFGPDLRETAQGVRRTSDGRRLDITGRAAEIASRLVEEAADDHADEIIKLMKSYCRPFDVSQKRKRLMDMGQRQKRARQARQSGGARTGSSHGAAMHAAR